MRIRALFGLTACLGLAALVPRPACSQLTAQAIVELKQSRSQQMQWLLPGSRSSARDTIATATIFSEQAVLDKATSLHIDATSSEVEEFLVPLLSKQGLIRVDGHLSISTDSNVQKWLAGQKWSMDQLFHAGRILLLWTKIVSTQTTCTEQEVKDYVTAHPDVYLVRPRLQLDLTQFDVPAQLRNTARGIAEAETIAPHMSLRTRAATPDTTISADSTLDWQGLRLFVEINRLDPVLRQSLEGKKAGDGFGPVELSDGSVVAGTISALLPQVDMSKSPDFWKYAVLLTKLQKSHQQELFDKMSKDYLAAIKDPTIRGIFGDVLGVVGTGVGSLFGGVGAPVGGIIGGAVGGWIDGQVSSATPASVPSQQQTSSFSPSFFPGPTFPSAQTLQPYMGPVNMPMPPVFQSGFPQMPMMNFIPPMPPMYSTYFNQMMMPRPSPPWGLPIFMPMPAYY
jgi:hypothetical protein